MRPDDTPGAPGHVVPAPGVRFTRAQAHMVGHGAAVMLVALLAGMGLVASLIGGIEVIPGRIWALAVPGSTDGWVRAHVGGLLNGVAVLAVAAVSAALGCTGRTGARLAALMAITAWGNTLFYWAALLAPNRALSFADNTHGPSNAAAVVALVGALPAAVAAVVAMGLLLRAARAAGARADR